MIENATELSESASQEETDVTIPETQETLNSEPVFEEIEPILNPWDYAPNGVIFYKEIKDNGQIIGFTIGAELAYKIGLSLDNYLTFDDIQQSNKDFKYYLKELCPMKTEKDKFNEAKQNKLSELKQKADSALNGAYVVSSLGFKADANPAAVRDLEGLVIIGADSVMFCDYENNFHPLNKEQVLTLQREILLNGQNLYAQKWTIRQQINEAETVEAINAIEIHFDMLSFQE